MLKKIECYLRPSKLDELQDQLIEEGVPGMTISEANGFGRSGHDDEADEVTLEERMKVEIVLDESLIDPALSIIKELAGKGEIGAGKIFVIPVEDAIRISTDESGRKAIY